MGKALQPKEMVRLGMTDKLIDWGLVAGFSLLLWLIAWRRHVTVIPPLSLLQAPGWLACLAGHCHRSRLHANALAGQLLALGMVLFQSILVLTIDSHQVRTIQFRFGAIILLANAAVCLWLLKRLYGVKR